LPHFSFPQPLAHFCLPHPLAHGTPDDEQELDDELELSHLTTTVEESEPQLPPAQADFLGLTEDELSDETSFATDKPSADEAAFTREIILLITTLPTARTKTTEIKADTFSCTLTFNKLRKLAMSFENLVTRALSKTRETRLLTRS
jgi:hypothetical protein